MFEIPVENKVIVFYHKDCIDGFVSALVANYFLVNLRRHSTVRPNVKFQALAYGDVTVDDISVIEPYLDSDYILMIDFSLKKDVMLMLNDKIKGKMVVLDHHLSVFKEYGLEVQSTLVNIASNITMYINDNSKSGAILAYDFFTKGIIDNDDNNYPLACVLADDGDRWLFKQGDKTRYFRAALSERMNEWDITDYWTQLLNNEGTLLTKLLNEGKVLHNGFMSDIETLYKTSGSAGFGEWRVNIANAGKKYASELGNKLASTPVDGEYLDFGMVYYYDHNKNMIEVSLRSIGDFDVSEVAREFGGGGHKNAAGMKMTAEEFMMLLSLI